METQTNEKNVFKINAKVLLEGVEIPYSNVSVSYGIDSEPSCTITLPGCITLRELPDCTTVHVIYKDPQDSEDAEWKLLFDGELEGWNYSIDANSASISLSAIHGTKWLNMMQLIIQEACAKAAGMDNIDWSGGVSEVGQINGVTFSDTAILKGMFPKNVGEMTTADVKFKSMADMIYCLIEAHISPKLWSAGTTAFFRNKIKHQYHLQERIAGISSGFNSVCEGIIDDIKVKNGSQNSGTGTDDSKDMGKPKSGEKVDVVLKGSVGVADTDSTSVGYDGED